MTLLTWVYTARRAFRSMAIACALAIGVIFQFSIHPVQAQVVTPATPPAGTVFRDCADCPEMVVIPAGGLVMGSPASEEGRNDEEGPQRSVGISRAFAAGKFEVTRGQYARFASETKRPALGNCWYWSPAQGKFVNEDPSKDWISPGFVQADDHPVVCVTWNDAQAYAQWLSRKSGKSYRLLTEAQWEYAARASSSTARPWGEDPALACEHANVLDQSFVRVVYPGEGRKWPNPHGCDDGSAYTSRVGRYAANRFGLHDMIGNAWEWVEDCWNDHYVGAPTDGNAWTGGDCARRVLRGGGWYYDPRDARSAYRNGSVSASRGHGLGFRLARTL